MTLLVFAGRFLYVPFLGDWDIKYEDKIFGFTWLSTFLSRIGNEFSWLLNGLLFVFISQFIQNEKVKKYIRNYSALVIITALYFICWAFYNGNNFHRYTEMFFAAITSLAAYIIGKRTFNFLTNYISSLIAKISQLVDVIVLKAPKHVKDVDVWDANIVEPTLDKLNE